MDDLFSWRQRPWHPVNDLDPDGTAYHYHQMQDLFEISLGSYQPRLTRGYISLIQWLTALHDEDICTLDQYHEHLSRLPTNDEGFITDIEEEPTPLSEPERQLLVPYSTKANAFCGLHGSFCPIHRRHLLLLNMVQGAAFLVLIEV